jgi:hypothetical protein
LKSNIRFDLKNRTIEFSIVRWLGLQKVTRNFALDQVVSMNPYKSGVFGMDLTVIIFADGSQITLGFSRKADTHKFSQLLSAKTEAGLSPVVNLSQTSANMPVSVAKSQMARQLRSWQIWLVIIGIGQMVAAKGFSPWGSLLILVSIASVYFANASMFAIFAVTILWAGISDLFSGVGVLMGISILQFIIAFQVFRRFLHFQQIERAEGIQTASRTSRAFPWAALVLGAGSFFCLTGLVAVVFINALTIKNSMVSTAMGWLETISVYAALIGLATGIAAWVAAYPRKWTYIIGTIFAGLALLLQLGLMLLAALI